MKRIILILSAFFALSGCWVSSYPPHFSAHSSHGFIEIHPAEYHYEKKYFPSEGVYVCKIKTFTSVYEAESTNRGRARRDVQKQCQANHNKMFCELEDISCTEYN